MTKDIEAYIEELKDISEKLSGEMKLKEAVDLYKKGVRAAAEAEKLLQSFEKEIEIIEVRDEEV